MFRCFGRAMIRPIFDQVTKRNGRASPELLRALRWWRDALELNIGELRAWGVDEGSTAHLFCDASGAEARLGSVLCCDGLWYWTTMVAPPRLLENFRHRADNQIMGLELLAITLGLGTFEELLRGRRIVVHCDNRGAEVCHPSHVVSARLRVWFSICRSQ